MEGGHFLGHGKTKTVALAAADSNSHLDTLMQISEILQDEEKAEKMLKSGDAETLYSFFA